MEVRSRKFLFFTHTGIMRSTASSIYINNYLPYLVLFTTSQISTTSSNIYNISYYLPPFLLSTTSHTSNHISYKSSVHPFGLHSSYFCSTTYILHLILYATKPCSHHISYYHSHLSITPHVICQISIYQPHLTYCIVYRLNII